MKRMMKMTLKRKMSGKKIRQNKRKAELHPTAKITVDGVEYEHRITVNYENRGIYNRNKPQARHVENPNIYKDESPILCGISNIRVPRKCRKTAIKRFKKAFPYIEINKNKCN